MLSLLSVAFQFEPMNFVRNLNYLGEGMMVIIVVMAALIAVTSFLNKVTKKKK